MKSPHETWCHRMLKFIGRTMRQDQYVLPKLFLSARVKVSMSNGKPRRKSEDTISESLRTLTPSVPKSGDHDYWVGRTCNELEWEEMIKHLAIRTRTCYNNHNDYPHTHSRESRDDYDHEQPRNDNACVPDTPHPPTLSPTTRTNSSGMLSPIFDFSIKTYQQTIQDNY